jgi:hypothetical protein
LEEIRMTFHLGLKTERHIGPLLHTSKRGANGSGAEAALTIFGRVE